MPVAGVAAVAVASGPSGYLVDGKLVGAGGVCVADDWFSTDLTSWARAHTAIPPTGSSQVLAVAARPTRLRDGRLAQRPARDLDHGQRHALDH